MYVILPMIQHLYFCGKNLDFVLTKLDEHSIMAIEWFENNYMKMNSVKCHLFISGNKFEHLCAKIGNDRIWENRTDKLLGITIDNELKFDEYLSNVCLKAYRKLSSLTRLRKYLDFKKIRILFKGFSKAQFKYCPLTWMFYSRCTNRRINYLHERALRSIYEDYELTGCLAINVCEIKDFRVDFTYFFAFFFRVFHPNFV